MDGRPTALIMLGVMGGGAFRFATVGKGSEVSSSRNVGSSDTGRAASGGFDSLIRRGISLSDTVFTMNGSVSFKPAIDSARAYKCNDSKNDCPSNQTEYPHL